MSGWTDQLQRPLLGGSYQEMSFAPEPLAEEQPREYNEFTTLLFRDLTEEELQLGALPPLPEPEPMVLPVDGIEAIAPDILPGTDFNMELVDAGFLLRARTGEERLADDKSAAYEIEVLRELDLMGFARGGPNHPMGYLLIGRGRRPLSFVPFYVPKTISGMITPEVLDSAIKNVEHIGFFHPRRTAASATLQKDPGQFLFIAPLFVADDIKYEHLLEKDQGGGVRSWFRKSDCIADVQDIVIWNKKRHPPYDYSPKKRVRTPSHAADGPGQAEKKKVFLAKRNAPYVPGGDAEFGRDWEKPKPKTKRKPAKSNVPKDPITREALLQMRLHLQHDDPDSGPAPVPTLFGGELPVKVYAESVYETSVPFLGIDPETISSERKTKVLLEISQLIPSHHNTYHQRAQWQIEGHEDNGGYGIPLSLTPEVRRAKALALLENENFLYKGGADREPTAIKYSHPSIRQLNWRDFQADVAKAVHPEEVSKQNISERYNIPSLAKKFSVLGGATTVSFIHDELVSISGLKVPIRQRAAFFADMKGAAGAQAESEVWPDWIVIQKDPAPVHKPNRAGKFKAPKKYESESRPEGGDQSEADASASD